MSLAETLHMIEDCKQRVNMSMSINYNGRKILIVFEVEAKVTEFSKANYTIDQKCMDRQ